MSRLSSRKLSVLASYIYDGAVNKPGTRSRISYFSDRPLTTYAIQEPCRAEDHDYIGNYEFKNGRVHRVNTPYGYIAMGGFFTYLRDYQGNNRNHASYYAYGLPVQGSEVKDPDPYLYGGKEFYSLKVVNLYDFNARTYAPDIARFMQPDPLATENMGVSPYTYCNGDPINNIDPDGMETHVFQNDSTMSKFASNYPDDGSINIVSHGNPTEIVKRTNGNRLSINTPELLKELINDNYETVNGNVSLQESIVIRILACKTGRDKDENTPSVAQTFSEGIPNAIIIAPNSRLCLKADGTMEAVDDNDDDIRSSNVPWRVFHRGKEFKVKDIPTIQKKLSNEIFFKAQILKLLLKTNVSPIPKTVKPILNP